MTKAHLETNNSNAQECWESVQRIAASGVFHRAPRIRELLLYLADRSLRGSPEDLAESHIADKVFGRKNYNPAEDNLVRASVRQLRLKLKQYFETEGKGEPWVLDLPKGTYHICFSQCSTEQAPFIPPPVPEPHRPTKFQPSPTLFAIAHVIHEIFTCRAYLPRVVWTGEKGSHLALQR